MGFFAEAGPLQVFVSQHVSNKRFDVSLTDMQLIPSDFVFDQTATTPSFLSTDGTTKIEKDASVRLKIVGVRVDATEIVSDAPILSSYFVH